MAGFPAYKDLKRPDDTGLPLSWGTWGPKDQLGTLNNITPELVVQACQSVKRGQRFNLDLPLHEPYGVIKPGAHASRRAPTPTLYKRSRPPHLMVRDDKLDEFFLQCSSQWDGLTHMGDLRHGFYNGVQDDQVHQGEGTRNGIEHVAEFGLMARGVLIDLVRYYAATGKKWDPMTQQVASAADVAACLKHQGLTLQPGDVLCVRMGWLQKFRAAKSVEERDALFSGWKYSGLSGEEDMWEFVWNNRVAALATDTVTVEVWPIPDGRPSMHLSIARLGLTIGEMFDFEALADDCAKDKRYTFLFTSKPLNVRGGVGSPPNAMAAK
ncbi:MAG TPA: cyclase family protein [bacterium]